MGKKIHPKPLIHKPHHTFLSGNYSVSWYRRSRAQLSAVHGTPGQASTPTQPDFLSWKKQSERQKEPLEPQLKLRLTSGSREDYLGRLLQAWITTSSAFPCLMSFRVHHLRQRIPPCWYLLCNFTSRIPLFLEILTKWI